MMVMENGIAFCIECRNLIECCFCACPYCGEMMKNCHCDNEISTDSSATSFIPHRLKPSLLKQSKKPLLINVGDDDWWRLEKWQIGRSKFP